MNKQSLRIGILSHSSRRTSIISFAHSSCFANSANISYEFPKLHILLFGWVYKGHPRWIASFVSLQCRGTGRHAKLWRWGRFLCCRQAITRIIIRRKLLWHPLDIKRHLHPIFHAKPSSLLKFDGITTLAKKGVWAGGLAWPNANLISWIYDTHNFYCVWTASVEHIRNWHMSWHFGPC